MPLVAALPAIAGIAGAGASIYGSINSGNAAKDAANTQAAAANQAAQLQAGVQQQALAQANQQFQTNQANFAPYIGAGASALQAQMALLGLTPYAAPQGAPQQGSTFAGGSPSQSYAPNYADYVQNNPDLLAAYQANSGGQSMDQFGQQHWQNYGQNEATTGGREYTPFGPRGQWQGYQQAAAQQDASAAPSAPAAPAQTSAQIQQASIDQLKGSPLYQSLYNTGRDSILANAAATGGLRGGNTQNSLARFGSDTLAQTIQQQLANLGGIANTGVGAAQNVGALNSSVAGNLNSISGQMASNQGNFLGQAGQANAGGILGGANANNQIAGQISQLPSLLGNSSFLSALGLGPKTPVSQPGSPLGQQYSFAAQNAAPIHLDQALLLPAF